MVELKRFRALRPADQSLRSTDQDTVGMPCCVSKNEQDQDLLQTSNGVGVIVSRQLLSLMHDKNFAKASQAAAFLGLIPKQVQSSTFKSRIRLAKNGSSDIRAKIYMAAVVSTRHNPDIKAQYEGLLANGKCKMQVICAAMLKLDHICFGVLKQ